MAETDYRRFEALAAELEAEEAAEAAAAAAEAAAAEGDGAGGLPADDTSPAGLAAAKAKAAGGLSKGKGGGGQLDDAELHPYFWDTIPENADEHPAKAALDAMLEEDTPEERALNYKVRPEGGLCGCADVRRNHAYLGRLPFIRAQIKALLQWRDVGTVRQPAPGRT